jgi:aspartate-semialdehyde dehydrogenase
MGCNGRTGRSVAVVGATGAVGEVLLRTLCEREFPVRELVPLASARSAGRTLRFAGRDVCVTEARPEAFDGVDLVFFAATGTLSRELAPEAVRRGAVVIDKSSSWRLRDAVPLVIPEINADALARHEGIVASPNCTTVGVAMALAPIARTAGLTRVVVTTLQAATGAGLAAGRELERQIEADLRGETLQCDVFPRPLAGNVLPLCETFRDDAYSTEEVKLLHETRKILALPDLEVAMTCVRVPVAVGHAASLLVETERPLSPEAAREVLDAFPGVRVVDDPQREHFPTPRDVVGQDDVLVGRVRRDLASDRLWLWSVVDNLRKGAATNAVQIAEELVARDLV